MTAPWPTGDVTVVPYAIVFGLMLAGNGYVVVRLFPRRGEPATLADATILIGILLMAIGLWFALIYAILDPGGASEVSVFIALNSMMGVVGCWAIALFLRAEHRPLRGRKWVWPSVFAALMLGNELLMGLAFVLAEAGPGTYSASGWTGLASAVGDSATSVWFFWAMLANMLILVYWLPIEPRARTVLTMFSLSAATGPWLVTAPLAGGLAMGALMAIVVYAMLAERHRAALDLGYLRVLTVVWGAFGGMTFGEVGFLLEPNVEWKTFVLGGSVLLAMGAELVWLLRHGLESPRPWGSELSLPGSEKPAATPVPEH